MNLISTHWRSNHRFLSAEGLRRFLLEQKLQRGIDGELLQVSSRAVLNAASMLTKLGEVKWRR